MVTAIYLQSSADNFVDRLEVDDLNYPLQKFAWNYEMDGAEIGKPQQPGRHPWRKDVRHMPLDIEGEILSDTTSEFWDKRKALMQKIIPPYDNDEYDPIRIELEIDGDGNTYYGYFVLDNHVGALEATGAPTVQAFQIHLSCRFGYWKNVATDEAVIL